MSETPIKVRRAIGSMCLVAILGLGALSFAFPAQWTHRPLLGFLLFGGVALVTEVLAVASQDELSPTITFSVAFMTHLGAILILYPLQAGLLAALSALIHLGRKPLHKVLYNTGQLVTAAMAGYLVYCLLGGQPGMEQITFQGSFMPFMGAAIVYFATNSLLVAYIISTVQECRLWEVWREHFGRVVLFNTTMSPMDFIMGYLYVEWGWLGLLTSIVPIVGLRYSYLSHSKATQLNQDLLRVLVRSLEARDAYTSGHSVRVAARAERIGREMGLTMSNRRIVETAALLHDIGKIDDVYAEILFKEGQLTD